MNRNCLRWLNRQCRSIVGKFFVTATITKECAFETMLESTGIVFPMVIKRGSRIIGLLLECNWDQEDGLAVVFDDDMIEVGTQVLLT
jgi:hypothetical protein